MLVEKEITDLKKEKIWLTNLSYKLCKMPDTPVHTKYKEAVNIFCNRLEEIKKVHWTDWLEESSSIDIYTTNKYITSEPSNYSNARIPSKTKDPDGHDTMASENTAKVKALADTFFPPPPDTPIIPAVVCPEPLKAKCIFTRDNIHRVIKKLKQYKVPGSDTIQNIVLQKCTEALIEHLYYIFQAILELDTYPSRWLIILTIVLHKAGKLVYNIAKSYHPIGLFDTLGKLFSTLVTADLQNNIHYV